MSTPIFNREYQHPSDGWYQIEAKAEHPNAAAGVVQVIDDKSIQSMVNRFNADAAAGKLRHGNEMLIDHEHFSDQPDKETRAYGWLQELQARPDGVYGRIHWTNTGRAAVDGGDYRFFSTEYSPSGCEAVGSGGNRIRPLRLDGLTLTNMNNNRGQKPITNRDAARQRDVEDAKENGEAQKKAAWLFNRLVSLEQSVNKCPASTAWSIVRNREPALYTLASGKWPAETILGVNTALKARLKFYNRAPTGNGTDWQAANARSSEVLDCLKQFMELDPIVAANSGIPHNTGLSLKRRNASSQTVWHTFIAQIRKLVRGGMSTDQAFQKLKAEQPDFWEMAMLSYEPVGEAA